MPGPIRGFTAAQRAALLIGAEAIAELRALGYALYPGALGENFTTTGLDRHQLRVGSRLRAGRATRGANATSGAPLLQLRCDAPV